MPVNVVRDHFFLPKNNNCALKIRPGNLANIDMVALLNLEESKLLPLIVTAKQTQSFFLEINNEVQ
jgi:hypothetical protein